MEKLQVRSVEEAANLARLVHVNQRDKQGDPYIWHVQRVADAASAYMNPLYLMVAWLHDVVEDGDVSIFDLRQAECPELVVEAVDAISRRKDAESYAEYIERVCLNPIAVRIKRLDLVDHFEQMPSLEAKQAASLRERYSKALRRVEAAIKECVNDGR